MKKNNIVKRLLIIAVCVVACLALLGTGTIIAVRAVAEKNSIGRDAAAALALADAGVSEAALPAGSGNPCRTELEYEDGRFVYDVLFTVAGTSYEYRLRASDGALVKASRRINSTPDAVSSATVSTSAASGETLTKEQARDIALADAGVSAADATFKETEIDTERGIRVYEIDFYTSEAEYEYKIDVATGDIRSTEKEIRLADHRTENRTDDRNPSGTGAVTPGTVTAPVATLTPDEARSAALADAGVSAADAVFIKTELDTDHGVAVFDIEFDTAEYEYDYEIDAVTGNVVSREKETRRTSGTASGNTPGTGTAPAVPGNVIGIDAAKDAALSHAGLTDKKALVSFSKAKLEDDHDRAEYEIEFYYNGLEYDYEIDAVTGNVTEYDVEKDD